MKKLLIYLDGYKKETILAPLFKMLEASFELFIPLVIASIVDKGINQNNASHILKMGILLILLALIGLTCSVTAQYFAARAAIGFGSALRHDTFSHIHSLSYNELDSMGTSTLITRMTNDINQVQSGVNMVLRLFLRSPFIVFGAMLMAFSVDLHAALIFVIVIPILSIIIFGIMTLTMPIYKKVQQQLDHVLLMTRENLIGARVVRAFNREETEIETFHSSSDLLYHTQILVSKLSSLMNPATYIVINAATIVILWIGGKEVFSGILTQGAVLALVNYMAQILTELIKLANLIVTITKSLACANRISTILTAKTSIKDLGKESTWSMNKNIPLVEFKNVDFSYPSSSEKSLSQISFSVYQGQTVGIIGGTGSGKTSLIQLIPRFYEASLGKILINGKDIKDYSLNFLRDKIGIVPQKAILFQGTIRENMKFGCQNATDAEIGNALSLAQAREIVENKPDKLDSFIEQDGHNLSGGQKQRLTIARALVKHPEILILDDSSSALDFATDLHLRKALNTLTNTTTFLVSQRVSSVKHADFILVLDDGKLVGCDTHENLYKSCKTYQEIYHSQMTKKEENIDE